MFLHLFLGGSKQNRMSEDWVLSRIEWKFATGMTRFEGTSPTKIEEIFCVGFLRRHTRFKKRPLESPSRRRERHRTGHVSFDVAFTYSGLERRRTPATELARRSNCPWIRTCSTPQLSFQWTWRLVLELRPGSSDFDWSWGMDLSIFLWLERPRFNIASSQHCSQSSYCIPEDPTHN